MSEELIGVVAASALALSAWAIKEVSKIEPLIDKVDHIRSQVDAIHSYLFSNTSRSHKG